MKQTLAILAMLSLGTQALKIRDECGPVGCGRNRCDFATWDDEKIFTRAILGVGKQFYVSDKDRNWVVSKDEFNAGT